jgi:exosome complex exonuclease DIS3/RRP44
MRPARSGSVQEVEAAQDVKSGKQRCGEVVGIVKRTWRARGYAGSLKEDTQATAGRTSNALFVAADRSTPFISIQTRQAAQLLDKVIVVVVDEWPVHSRHPLGHYVRTLGKIGELDTESLALLLEYDVNTAPFTAAVHACVPPLPGEGHWKPSAAEIDVPWRRDLRDLCVCSVDPPGCKDIDDALHARQLPNGNIEVGVHIADVTQFCEAGSAMDEEACRRSTTVYLVNRRIDMFPKPLTEDICRCGCTCTAPAAWTMHAACRQQHMHVCHRGAGPVCSCW